MDAVVALDPRLRAGQAVFDQGADGFGVHVSGAFELTDRRGRTVDGAATGPAQTRWTGRKPAEWAMPRSGADLPRGTALDGRTA
jgi:hypothetical protein